MALIPDRAATLASQVVLVPKEQMIPLENDAVINLAHYSKNVAEYTEFVEALGLEEARLRCRSLDQQTNNSPPVAI